jgi:hypothetical protein
VKYTRKRRKSKKIELNIFLRRRLSETDWHIKWLKAYNCKCAITGRYDKRRMHIHHVTPHFTIRNEVLMGLGLSLCYKLKEYTEEQLLQITVKYIEAHLSVEGIPLLKKVHKLFHKLYGYSATKEDFLEFKKRCDDGEFRL